MMSRNQPRPTKAEQIRITIMVSQGCVLTWAKFGRKEKAECHHIIMPGKRLGHWYTIPLSPWYHRKICERGKTEAQMRAEYGASLADGKRAFVASHHYTELELWQKLQVAMGLDDSLPATKIVPRRSYVSATEGMVDSPADPAHPLPADTGGMGSGARGGSAAGGEPS